MHYKNVLIKAVFKFLYITCVYMYASKFQKNNLLRMYQMYIYILTMHHVVMYMLQTTMASICLP